MLMPEVLNPGDLVECDDDVFVFDKTHPFKAGQLNLPEAEKQYTVREVVTTQHGIGIRLKEAVNKQFYFADIKGYREPIFEYTRFHLVDNA